MKLQDALQTIRQKIFPKTYKLETELAGLRDDHVRVTSELDTVRVELNRNREQGELQLAELQQQLQSATTERKAAQDQVRLLETSLANAAARQESAERHIQALEKKFDETSSRYEANIGTTQDTLLRLQTEQKNLLNLQADMAGTFNEVGKRLLESVELRMAQPRMSGLQMAAMAGLLFLSGALISVLFIRDDARTVDLAPLQSGIGDLQQLMRTHFESHDELLKILTKTLEMQTSQLDGELSSILQETETASKQLSERQRSDLLLLGFDAANNIDAALNEFRSLYMPVAAGAPETTDDEVDAVLGYYADLARSDSDRFQVSTPVLAAIRLASKRTGMEFSFLMELAAIESDFNPLARAPSSTAVGLYQFKEESWLDAIRDFGADYGLDRFRQKISYSVDSNGVMRPFIEDPGLLAAALELRLEPRLSALFAAEHARKNQQRLSKTLDQEPGRTELYLTHFFGASGAISFLEVMAENPEKIARDVFPGPAKRNRYVFQNRARKPRTVAEIYNLFARKFNTRRYRESEPG